MVTELLMLVVLMIASPIAPQQDRGTLTGSVVDSSGAVLSGVKVGIVNRETNATYDSLTNDVGQYSIPNLPIGTYKLTFEQAGFRNYVRETVRLSVSQVT